MVNSGIVTVMGGGVPVFRVIIVPYLFSCKTGFPPKEYPKYVNHCIGIHLQDGSRSCIGGFYTSDHFI